MPALFPGSTGLSATDTLAQLTRSQWADWYSTWKPYEDKQIDFAMSPTAVTDEMAKAQATVGTAFEQQAASTQERLRGLGLALTADESHALQRSQGLAKTLTSVGAQNSVRDQTMARQQAILGNPTPTIGG